MDRGQPGKPLQVSDVLFTFHLLKKFPALDSRGVWKYLKSVDAGANNTVVFNMHEPYVPLLENLAHQPIIPKHKWKDVKDPVAYPNENPVGTGPFTAVGSFQNQSYEVHKNPHYWRAGKPKMETIKFLAFPANEQLNLALIKGDLDWAGSFVPAIDRIFVAKDPEHHKYWFPPLEGMVFLYLNTAVEPFGDARVRKAVSMAVDRQILTKVAMHDYTVPGNATGLSDAYLRYRSAKAVKAGTWVNHDPIEAARLLDEAGLPIVDGGYRFSIDLIVPGGFSDWVRGTQVVVHQLEKVNIRAKVKTLDFNAWYEKLENGEFDASFGWSEVHPSPHDLYRGLMSTETRKPVGTPSPENWHRFGLKEADVLLSEMKKTTDFETVKALSYKLQDLFVEHAPAIPMFPGPLWGEFNNKRVKGFPSADNPYAPLSPNWQQSLLVLTELEPR